MEKDFDIAQGAGQDVSGAEPTVNNMKEKLQESADRLRHGAERLNSRIDEKFNAGREVVAEKLYRAAEGLHTGSHQVAEKAERAAQRMESSAETLRNYDAGALRADVKDLVARYPLQTILGSLAAGVLLGRAFRR